MQSTKRPALSRTWQATVTYRECGVVVSVDTHTITLSREIIGGPLAATVDGQPASVERAVKLLDGAHGEVLAEVLSQPTPPTIGKARACKLHQLMARAGVLAGHHYASAGRATARQVESLAGLTEQEARQVWAYLCNMFPHVRRAAA